MNTPTPIPSPTTSTAAPIPIPALAPGDKFPFAGPSPASVTFVSVAISAAVVLLGEFVTLAVDADDEVEIGCDRVADLSTLDEETVVEDFGNVVVVVLLAPPTMAVAKSLKFSGGNNWKVSSSRG